MKTLCEHIDAGSAGIQTVVAFVLYCVRENGFDDSTVEYMLQKPQKYEQEFSSWMQYFG